MEAEFIRWLAKRLAPSGCAPLGLSDDAALLLLASGGQCVVTTDLLMDGVHFELAVCGPRAAGRKSLAVNLSDLAAMAARPLAAFVSIAVPRSGNFDGASTAREVYEGLLPLAEEFDVAVAGGDTNVWDGPLVISITAIGEPAAGALWLRSGAQVGDEVLVTGAFGGSLRGKHLQCVPRVREALALAANYTIHAATDVSDGLSIDLAHILDASGCGAELDLQAIPIAPAAHELAASGSDGRTALDHALGDGEDFELVFTAAPDVAQRMLRDQPLEAPITRIGRIVAAAGLWRLGATGERVALQATGFEHR